MPPTPTKNHPLPPTLVISDTHLAHPQGKGVPRATMLRPLWLDTGIRRVILNGDAAEVHDPFVRGEALRQVLKLQELCEADGVELTLLAGNHDPFLTERRHLQLADEQVFITHGDVLHPAIAPWCRYAGAYRAEMQAALSEMPAQERERLEAKLYAATQAAHRHWVARQASHEPMPHLLLDKLLRPLAVARILHYWLALPGAAARFVRQHAPDTRFFLFGHSHRQGVWQRGTLTLINTGSFGFPGKPRAVRLDDAGLHLFRVALSNDRNHYSLTGPPLRRFPWTPTG